MTNEYIKNILLKEGKLVPQRCHKNYLIKHKLYNFINDQYDNSYLLNEKIYLIINNLSSKPRCKTCNQELNYNNGYSLFCSRKCSNADPEVLEKNRKNVSKSLKKSYKENGEKIKKKRAKTLYMHYKENATSPFGISKIQKQIKNTLKDKYGVENVFYLKKFRSNGKKVSQERSVKFNKINGYDIEYLDDHKILIKNLCKIHKDVIIDSTTFYNRAHKDRYGEICPICNPLNSFSGLENKFEKLLNEIGTEDYIKNTKNVISPYELDFYFPDKKIAFELNGVYWHSEIYKDKNYHKIKSDLCEENNIQLIHIWEDDFYNNFDLIKSMCKSKLGIIKNKIYARQCIIKEIKSNEYRNFLEHNHIQGIINSSKKYGLEYKNEIVAVMGFGKLRIPLGSKNIDGKYELHRFCTIRNTIVIGGASKLLSYFEKNNNYKEIITYAKRDYSNGNLYKQLGFDFIKSTAPGFYWLVENKRKHRYNYRKDRIISEKNKHMTAVEIMHEKGYIRCYDSGNLKFIKHKNSYLN